VTKTLYGTVSKEKSITDSLLKRPKN